MQKLKLITEASYDVGLSEGKQGDLYVTGIFSTAELENANGRKYKMETLKREVDKIQEGYLSKNLPFWGELGHPKSPEPNLDRIAIRTTMLEWKGNNLFGKAKVLDTSMGKEAQVLLKEGPIGISSRGLGTVNEDGYVNDSTYRLLAYDLVGNPSNHPSFVKGIYEAQEFVIYDQSFTNAVEEKVEELKEAAIKYDPKEFYEKLMKLDINKILKEAGPTREFGVIDSLKQLQDVSNDLYKTCSKWNFDDPKDRESFRKELNRIATSILQLKKTFTTRV